MKRYRRNPRVGARRKMMGSSSRLDIKHILAAILVASLPIMIFCLVANFVFRTSTIYEYNLTSSEILEGSGLITTQEDAVTSFTNFMQHRTGELTLIESSEYEPDDIFSAKDKAAMLAVRKVLDVMLVLGALAFLVSAACYFFLIRWRVKDVFMKRFKQAALVFCGISLVNLLINLIGPIRRAFYGLIMGSDFPDGDNLMLILKQGFAMQSCIFEILLGGIITMILGYITWQVAGRKKMFRGFR